MSDATGTPALFLYHVERHFSQGAQRLDILRSADLAVWPGQSVALIAPSGTGKSTLLQLAGLLDSWTGMILIECVINIPVALVLFVGFVQDIPEEMDAAAKIDGASIWGTLWHVIFPLSRPILFAVLILSFVYGWNEFLFGLILTTKQAVPVTVGATFFVTSYGVKWGATAAAMTLGIIPPLILGLFAYPYIGKSMLTGAVKG